jgi:hypothetical protein
MRPTPSDYRQLDETLNVIRGPLFEGHIIGCGVPSTVTARFWISRCNQRAQVYGAVSRVIMNRQQGGIEVIPLT